MVGDGMIGNSREDKRFGQGQFSPVCYELPTNALEGSEASSSQEDQVTISTGFIMYGQELKRITSAQVTWVRT